MISKCAWCHPKGNKFAAQKVMRHALSHGMCGWHQKFQLAKLDALDRKMGMSVKNETGQNLPNPPTPPTCIESFRRGAGFGGSSGFPAGAASGAGFNS